jgi:hypothetical protein
MKFLPYILVLALFGCGRTGSPLLTASGEFEILGFRVADGPDGYWPISVTMFVDPARREAVRQKDDEMTRIIASHVAKLKSEDLHSQLSQQDKDILVEINRLFPDQPVQKVFLWLEVK